MRTTRRRLVALTGVALFAGCGGDGDSDGSVTPTDLATTTAGDTTTQRATTAAGDTTTSPAPTTSGTDLAVTATDTDRSGDGTVTIRWRPATFDAFAWEGADGAFYEADPGSVYLVVQLSITASGGPHDYPSRSVTAAVDGEQLGTTALSGDLSVDEPIEEGETVTGWRAWEISESVGEVTLRHEASDAPYDTVFQRDDELPLEVSPYDG